MRDFNHTVNVLVKAFLNGTLLHGDCAACAVGNIIAAEIGATIILDEDSRGLSYWIRNMQEIQIGWSDVFCSHSDGQKIDPKAYIGQVKRQIDVTGYSWQELAKIEFAFEKAPAGGSEDEWMFNGLMAVVDVLADIHGVDLTQKENAKLLFVKA
jgi:hypothetical protein